MFLAANIIYDWKILLGFTLIIVASVVNSQITILPMSTLIFLLTSFILWFISLGATFFCLHRLLQKKEPLQLFVTKKPNPKAKRQIKPNPEKVKALTRDIDKYFISKWYSNISENNEFSKQSQLLLEELISRLAETQVCVNNKLLLHGSLNLVLRHFKEFRRSLKRREKYGGNIEELYRYSHICSNYSNKAKDYFLHQLTTNLLRHFINSELWNSLPCSILVSVLSRRLVRYLLNMASHPDIVNYILLSALASEDVKKKFNLANYGRINITEYFDVIDSTEVKEQVLKGVLKNTEPIQSDGGYVTPQEKSVLPTVTETDGIKIVETSKQQVEQISEHAKKNGDVDATDKKLEIHGKVKTEALTSEATQAVDAVQKHVSSDPVKIYEPKSSKANKTWRDSKDLGLGVSLGQDPLDALPVAVEHVKSFGKSTFWDTGKIEHFVEDSSSQLLNEVKHTTQSTMEGLKISMKPFSDATVNTLHNIKDLQETTVNTALHKIGDFQDEAASVVEGIFDFGKAGIRKGLRLTGLQDNIENAKSTLNVGTSQPKAQAKKKSTKTTKSETPEKSVVAEDCMDSVWMNPLTMESPNFDGQILLERPSENSSKTQEKEERELQIPFISMDHASNTEPTSPDPEYEDAADLASSIAKLRLLLQRSSESSTTPALSPMFVPNVYQVVKMRMVTEKMLVFGFRPPVDFSQKNTEADGISDNDEVDGVMPSFYKFCAKTATGVLDKTIHTIKTALPGTVQGVEQNDNAWIFIQNEKSEANILTKMKKLLTERKEYCTLDTEIDTAYEAIDSFDGFNLSSFSSNVEFEDELDDFEVKLPIAKDIVDIFCELLAETDTYVIQEPVIKAILLGFGYFIENFIVTTLDGAAENFCENLLTIPEISNQTTLNMSLEEFVNAISSSLPDVLKLALEKTNITKALTLLVNSLQVQKINEDLVLQIFELISMKLIEESAQLSPPASA